MWAHDIAGEYQALAVNGAINGGAHMHHYLIECVGDAVRELAQIAPGETLDMVFVSDVGSPCRRSPTWG
jgi:hypothetical protein